MRLFLKQLAAVLLSLAILAGMPAALADTMHREVDSPDIEMTAEIGYDGVITYGKAIPVRVRIRNWGADLEGVLGVNAYANTLEYNRYEVSVSIPSGAEKEYVLPVLVMTKQAMFTPELVVGGRVVEAVNVPAGSVYNPSAMLVGVLSTRPQALSNMTISQENDALSRYEYWQTVALDADTFPDSAALLNSFGVLVIDDIDPASLTDRQQEALNAWIEAGHILLCGGGSYAARNVAYFSGRTGLAAGETETSRNVLPALESFAGARRSGKMPKVTVAHLSGADPVIADEDGEGLVYRTEAGAGRIYTMAFEAGETRLNTESVMHYFWQQALVRFDSTRYNNVLYPASKSDAGAVYPGPEAEIPVRSPMSAAVVVIVGMMVLAVAAWILLRVMKKKERRTWMWAVLPALAAAAAALILLISSGSGLNRTMAVYAESLLQRTDGSVTRNIGISAASPSAGVHTYSLDGAPLKVPYLQDIYWYEDEDKAPSEPTEMAMCYTAGEEERMAVRSSTPWEVKTMRSESAAEGLGKVEAEIWMEGDGLHGTIRNAGTLSLKAGKVITSFGFVSVPAIRPGESADFALLETPPDPNGNGMPKDGQMVRNSGYSLYSMSYTAEGLEEYWEGSGRKYLIRNLSSGMLDMLTGGEYYSSNTGSVFLYYAEPEESIPLSVSADGRKLDVSGTTLFGAEMEYLTVGKTGIVFHAPGMDEAVRMELDGDGMPAGETQADPKNGYSKYYHTLSETPTFRIMLEDPRKVEITELTVVMDTWYASSARCYLLNVNTGEWDAVEINKPVKHPEDYLDAEGRLYCQFRPNTTDAYMDIPTPGVSLEGRVRNAAD